MLNVEKLKDLMIDVEIKSIRELAERVGLPVTTLYYMLNGHDMQVSTVMQLARFFSVPVDDLIEKNYHIVAYNESGSKVIEASSLIEATYIDMFS